MYCTRLTERLTRGEARGPQLVRQAHTCASHPLPTSLYFRAASDTHRHIRTGGCLICSGNRRKPKQMIGAEN